ncbi:hypothetical protein TCAL_13709 [Tigriopus californicus]|uniref:DUF5641 domain-containing protein n=1 Tax=Tigriopus californicus TaxID=6832 RepID=A0A553P1G7_TIGCA|nr:hypothetical protein TCAL_13709 [Tigriopus californicus]
MYEYDDTVTPNSNDPRTELGFQLAKWLSNDNQFHLMDLGQAREANVLGLTWNAPADNLRINLGKRLPIDKDNKMKKRTLFDIVPSLYSPLGLAAPFIVKGKIKLAQLHLPGMGWDDNLEDALESKNGNYWRLGIREEVAWWKAWIKSIPKLGQSVWKIWHANYLPTLIVQAKWKSEEKNLEVNDVVLIVDPLIPRGQWRWGYVTKVFAGRDGLV